MTSAALHQDAKQITAQLYASLDANPAVRTAAEAALRQAALMPGALAGGAPSPRPAFGVSVGPPVAWSARAWSA